MQNDQVTRSSIPSGVTARVVTGLLVVFFGLGGLVIARGPGTFTTYAGHSTAGALLASVAGLSLAAAAVVLSLSRSPVVIAHLTLLAGLTWFAPLWTGWAGGPPLVRTLGMLAAGFTFPLVLHVVLAYPTGRLRTTLGRAVVGATYAEAFVATIGLALFRDPFYDPHCWANCTDNVFLVHSLPSLARSIETTHRWFSMAAAAALGTLCVWRSLTDSGPARRVVLPVAVPGVLFAAAVAAHSIALQQIRLEDPSDPVFFSIFVIMSTAVTLLAAGLLWGCLRRGLERRAVTRIVTGLGAAPVAGSLESAVAQALRDPTLRVAYWLPDAGGYVDARGHPVAEPAGAPGRVTTALVRDGRPVALVSHVAGIAEIESELGPAVRLALENERLQAEGLAQLNELRASRARIVQTGDAERRRLERDLHDGAQQRLLAVSYDLRRARMAAEADGDGQTASLLENALDAVHDALKELRELAHGIYPAILAEAGLAAALATLADTAPLRVEITTVTDERYPSPVETAAYVLVAEALESAATRGATWAVVSAVRDREQLEVTVEDDGSQRTSAMIQLDDRVGALGGMLKLGPRTLVAAIPCE
jgi:signal transduction histidine kinase